MDANGIGTDATMAEHIAKIKERSYVHTRLRNSGNNGANAPARGGRGGARGGRGGGRGGAAAAGGGGGGGGGLEEFIPSTLGVALVDGYDRMGHEESLSKPFLRKEMELSMREICEGRKTRGAVLRDSLRQYKAVFMESQQRAAVLKAVSLLPGINIC